MKRAFPLEEIVEWDISNWTKAIEDWERVLPDSLEGFVGLEIGGKNGGLSLYLALKGCHVICSDVVPVDPIVKKKMEQHGVSDRVVYKTIDALSIDYPENSVDIVAFKSIFGSIGRNNHIQKQKKAIEEMWRVLKPKGYLLFAENLRGSKWHMFFRRKYTPWGNTWRYITPEEMLDFTYKFSHISYNRYGHLACFGRDEKERSVLALVDKFLYGVLKEKYTYILFGHAIK